MRTDTAKSLFGFCAKAFDFFKRSTTGSATAQQMKAEAFVVLEVQFGQPVPVQQHDLALGLVEEAENAHAVKM